MAIAQQSVRFGRVRDLRVGRSSDVRSDKSLVRSAQSGKPEATSTLIERHYPRVFSFVSYLTNGRGNAEDLTQEVFTRALGALGKFNGRYQFEPWLLRIARNLVIDESRKDTHRPSPTDPVELPEIEKVSSDTDAVWNSMAQQLAGSTVRGALEKMPLRQRTVLVLREIEEMSYADIAQIVGTNVRGVEGTLRRAKARFRLEASFAESLEAEQAECKRTLRLIALDGETRPGETDQHLAGCSSCRKRSSSIRSADGLFAILPPLALGGADWGSAVAAHTAAAAGGKVVFAARRALEAFQGLAGGSAATPLAGALQIAGSIAVAGAVSATAVAGYTQISGGAESVSFPAPVFAPVFQETVSEPAVSEQRLAEETSEPSSTSQSQVAAPTPALTLGEPVALVSSVLDILTANLLPQQVLDTLPLARQIELLGELPDQAITKLAETLAVPTSPLTSKQDLLAAIKNVLATATSPLTGGLRTGPVATSSPATTSPSSPAPSPSPTASAG